MAEQQPSKDLIFDLNDPECDVHETWRQFFDSQMEKERLPKLFCGETQLEHCLILTNKSLMVFIRNRSPHSLTELMEDYNLARALIAVWEKIGLIKFYHWDMHGRPVYVSIESC
jgi:hypothetical protein